MPPFYRVFALSSCLFFLTSPLGAQQIDLAKAYDQGVSALDSGKFDAGLKVVQTVLDKFAGGGEKRYGPAFGHFYYLKGMLLIRQKKYAEAIEPLKVSYEKYPNAEGSTPPNVFHTQALFQWGMCLQLEKDYTGAADKFRKALDAPAAPGPKLNRLAVEMNLAQCLIKTGKEAEGKAMLSKILDLKNMSEEAIRDAFTLFAAGGGMEGGEGMDIVQQHAGALFGSAEDREIMNPRLAGLGAKALQEGDPLQAIVWYNLMTPPNSVIDRYERQKKQLLTRRDQSVIAENKELTDRIDKAISELEQKVADQRKSQGDALLGMAAAHFQIGSVASARAIYRQLIEEFTDYGDRPVLMHNLIVCETNLARWDEAIAYGERFFEEFSTHEMKPDVSRVLAEVVFLQGDYDRGVKMASDARKGLVVGSEKRAGLDFVVAAGLFLLQEYERAESELSSFLEAYPDSPQAETAQYYLGTARVKLNRWSEAIPVLAEYVEKYRDAEARPTAMFLTALGYLIVEDPNQAFVTANKLMSQHIRAKEVPSAYNVKGDAQAALEYSYTDITNSYQTAINLAMKQGADGDNTIAYALKQLIATASDSENHEEAVKYFERFREKYSQSIFNVDATIAVVPSYVGLEKLAEAKKLFEGLVQNLLESSGDDFDQVFRSYTAFLNEHYELDETLAALDEFSGRSESPAMAAWLLIGQIEALEGVPTASRDKAAIDDRFVALQKLHKASGNEISSYALVRLARWHQSEKDEPAAKSIYNMIIKERPNDNEALGYALIDTAKADYEAGGNERMRQALDKFQRVINDLQLPNLNEEAVLGVARILTKAKNYDDAEGWWQRYREIRTWKLARAEANYNLARCMEESGRREEAMKMYITVYANFPSHLDWSTQAYIRASDILWKTGRNLDALKMLQDLLKRTRGSDHPGVIQAKEIFFDWRNQYSAKAKP